MKADGSPLPRNPSFLVDELSLGPGGAPPTPHPCAAPSWWSSQWRLYAGDGQILLQGSAAVWAHYVIFPLFSTAKKEKEEIPHGFVSAGNVSHSIAFP